MKGDGGHAARRVRLCSRSQVPPGEMLPIDADGLPPLAVFNVANDIYVTSNLCTHNVAILTNGIFDGETIECPLHGGCFNVRTGAALQFPCEKPLRTYPVGFEGDEVFIEIEDS